MPLVEKDIYGFDRFVLNPVERVLSYDGTSVPLTPKAFDTLICLVRNQGHMVTKDELLRQVWPDTFVEEVNLAVNISVIRKALGESPQECRFIATVPGRGYRFVAEVRKLSDQYRDGKSSAVAEHAKVALDSEARTPNVGNGSAALGDRPAADPVKRRRLFTPAILAATAILASAVLLAGELLWRWREAPRLTPKDTIVLADFTNTTGDAVFDGALRQGLSAQLEQSPFLNLLSDTRIAQTLALMAQPRDAQFTPVLAREVCQRTASAASIEGSIASLGSQYVLGFKAVNCHSGDLLADEQVTANSKEQVLRVLGDATRKLRKKLGESLASVEKYDTPLESVTTPSLEALQAYSLGYRAQYVKNDPAAAIPLFWRAISLDPNFAMAYARLGTNFFNLGQTARAAENTRKAYELRERVSERERFYIASHYEEYANGDLEAARKIYESWTQTYPRDNLPLTNLAGNYFTRGEYDKALSAAQEAFNLDPGQGSAYASLVVLYIVLNRLDEAKTTAQEARSHNLASPSIHLYLYTIAFLQHDAAGAEREAAGLMGKPGYEDVMLYTESDTAAYTGQFVKARELTRRAADSAQRADERETAAGYDAEAAVREALIGNAGLARQQAQVAVALSRGRDVEAISAAALGLAGDSAQAMRLANDLSQRFPKDTMVQSEYLPIIHAVIILGGRSATRDADKAIEALAAAAPYELGNPAQTVDFNLYPVYLRGEAYLAAHQGAAAVTEFQKILDHPGVVLNEPLGALAYLGLGRAYAMQGDTAKAHTKYHDVLNLWKDADSDIPILKEAKAEYTKLQ